MSRKGIPNDFLLRQHTVSDTKLVDDVALFAGGTFILFAVPMTAEDSADTSQQFLRAKGFSDIIIRPQIQCLHLVPLVGTSGEHNDGHSVRLSHLLDQAHAIPIRQAKIQNDEIRMMGSVHHHKVSGIVSGISILFKPIVWLLSVSTNAVLKMLGIDPDEAEAQICEEDIRMMVETGGETGAIDKDEQDFIQNVFKFDDLSAGEILTHRTDLIMLWLEDTDDTWEKIICSSFSRYPICDGSPDKVVGVLNAKVYLREKDRNRENVMRSALEPAYFVPETVKADVLFRNMKQTHTTFAFVLDEYGGLTGIVTMHDLIEELIGEIRDEHDKVAEDFEKLDENTYRVDCSVSLEDFMEFFDVKLESDSVSVGGWVMEQLNRVPIKGDSFAVQNLEITVSDLRAYRVSFITVRQCGVCLACEQ